jgi:hypothetical protein
MPTSAAHVPDGPKPDSRGKRFTRWIRNAQITDAVYVLPYAAILVHHLAVQTRVLVLEGRVVGRGGVALMRHVG